MSAENNHALPNTQNEKVLWTAFALTTTFLILEAVAGLRYWQLSLMHCFFNIKVLLCWSLYDKRLFWFKLSNFIEYRK